MLTWAAGNRRRLSVPQARAWQRLHVLSSAPLTVSSMSLLFRRRIASAGFTLLELLVVIAIMAIATSGVGLAMRDTSVTALEREAQRLAVLFESARAQSRSSGIPVYWHVTEKGFQFDGLMPGALPENWLGDGITARSRLNLQAGVRLGPEPIIGPQSVEVVSSGAAPDRPERVLYVSTDGLRPFAVRSESGP
ncbi:MAG: gspH [Polaromonas sp.]|nr:gspH [Polaromonas sp.]